MRRLRAPDPDPRRNLLDTATGWHPDHARALGLDPRGTGYRKSLRSTLPAGLARAPLEEIRIRPRFEAISGSSWCGAPDATSRRTISDLGQCCTRENNVCIIYTIAVFE